MSDVRNVTVVGGGIIGCCAAYYLARLGCQVTLLERDELGEGASYGNCGYICPSHILPMATPKALSATIAQCWRRDGAVAVQLRQLPRMLPWMMRFLGRCNPRSMREAAVARHELLRTSHRLYRELLSAHDLACGWQDRGLLVVYQNREHFETFAEVAALLQADFGLTINRISGDQLPEREPLLRPGLAGGWLFPHNSHLRPDLLIAELRKLLMSLGVTIREHVEVRVMHVHARKLKTLETSAGAVTVDHLVLATGAEAPQFAAPLGCRLPIQPGKGYSLTFPATGRLPSVPMIFEEHHVAVTPFEDGLRIGSTMEFAGLDRSINRKRVDLLMRSAAAHLQELPVDPEVVPWSGWRPMTFDGIPRIGRPPGANNVVVAAGNGMIGLASAPATGKLAAELLVGAPPHISPTPYALG